MNSSFLYHAWGVSFKTKCNKKEVLAERKIKLFYTKVRVLQTSFLILHLLVDSTTAAITCRTTQKNAK